MSCQVVVPLGWVSSVRLVPGIGTRLQPLAAITVAQSRREQARKLPFLRALVMTIDTSRRPRYTQGMFGISGEHLLILGIVLLIFGPRRLPELGNTLGKAIRNFKDAISGVEEAQFRRLDKEAQGGATPVKPAQPATANTEKVAETADSGTPKNS